MAQPNYYEQRTNALSNEKSQSYSYSNDTYPHKYQSTISIKHFIDRYNTVVPNGTPIPEKTEQISSLVQPCIIPYNTFVSDINEALIGRIMLFRIAGKKLLFLTVSSNGQLVQFLINMMHYKDNFEQI